MKRADGSVLLLNPYPPGTCTNNLPWLGGFTGTIAAYDDPATYTRAVTAEEIGGAQSIRFVFEFTSDNGWSDEDGDYTTTWGPFGADDVTIRGGGIDVTQDFENGIEPWTPSVCPGVGVLAGIAPFECYDFIDPCDCRLSGNVLELHVDPCPDGFHPDYQYERLESPICDIGTGDAHNIFLHFDLFAEMPIELGVTFRVRWRYYPWTCPVHGITQWSQPVGGRYEFMGADPDCFRMRYSATDGSNPEPIPQTSQKVMAVIELLSDCNGFTIDPCLGNTNSSPLFDNLAVGTVPSRVGPMVQLATGMTFQDVGSTSGSFDPRGVGAANVTFDKHLDEPQMPRMCGDSLVVTGPLPVQTDPNTRWEARLWWRVARRALFNADREGNIVSRYKIWRDRVADGRAIDRAHKPEFTYGWMDSVQIVPYVRRDRFQSTFRENDDDFAGESNPANEMLPDDVFYPGTRIEYFVTSNYANTPNALYYLPDTTGGNFLEFEILPGVRTATVPGCGGNGFNVCAYTPSTLYIDADNAGAQIFIENALATILSGQAPCGNPLGCAIPADGAWDRYDYTDANSNWAAPFARGGIAGSNNGMTLQQIVGYRTILLNTGAYSGATNDSDYALLQDWLTTPQCDANVNRQALLLNGDGIGQVLSNLPAHGRPLLEEMLGAALYCDAFNGWTDDADCGPIESSYCLRYLPAEGAAFGPELAVDAFGNGCPNRFAFNVFSPTGSGRGNRGYESEDGPKAMDFGQVVNENLSADANYRSVVDGVSWHHMTTRDAAGQGSDLCPRDLPSVVSGIVAELGPALRWTYDVPSNDAIPTLTNVESLARCQSTWTLPADAADAANPWVNRLWQNDPNPFNPRTTIRYSTARDGAVKIIVFDVGGRIVRTLVDGRQEAGLHTAVWDGTNDRRSHVGSGVYWVQMRAGEFISNKKMIVLK